MAATHPFQDPARRQRLFEAAAGGAEALRTHLDVLTEPRPWAARAIAAAEALLPYPGRRVVLPMLAEGVQGAVHLDDYGLATRGALVAARIDLADNRLDEVPGQLNAVEVLGTRAGDGFRVGFGRLLRAEYALATGHPGEALDRVHAMLKAFQEGEGVERLDVLRRYAYTLRVLICAHMGDSAGLEGALEAADGMAEGPSALRTYHHAVLDLAQGRTDAARRGFEGVVEQGEDGGWVLESLLALSAIDPAGDALDRARTLAEALDDMQATRRVFLATVRRALHRGAHDEAAALLGTVDDTDEPDLVLLRAEVATEMAPPDQALPVVERLIELARTRKLPGLLARGHLLAAHLFPDIAARAWQLRQARLGFERLGDRGGVASVMVQQALLEVELGGPEKAMSLALEAQDVGRRTERPDILAHALVAQARAATALGQVDEARGAFTAARELAATHGLGGLERTCRAALDAGESDASR